MIHLTLQQLSAYLDGELTDASTELVRRHLSECDNCTGSFGRIEAQEEILARVLVDEPDDEFFKALSAAIATAIGARGKAESKPAASKAEMKPPKRARVAAESASPVVLPAPLPIVPAEPVIPPPPVLPPEPPPIMVPLERPMPQPHARHPEPQRPVERAPSRGGAGGWIAAIVILVLAGSVAWVMTHRGSSAPTPSAPSEPNAPSAQPDSPSGDTSSPETNAPETAPAIEPSSPETSSAPVEESPPPPPQDAPVAAAKPARKPPPASRTDEPERLMDRPVQNVVPVRRVVTQTTLTPESGEPPATQPSPAVAAAQEAAARKRLIDDAKRVSLRAAQSMEATVFDDAANAWEKALPAVENAPEDQAIVRRELAQARFQAWAKTPTAARREAAIAASRAYLLYAPPGPERDQAWTWLGRLKQP